MSRETWMTPNPASGPNSSTRTEPFVKVIALIATHCYLWATICISPHLPPGW